MNIGIRLQIDPFFVVPLEDREHLFEPGVRVLLGVAGPEIVRQPVAFCVDIRVDAGIVPDEHIGSRVAPMPAQRREVDGHVEADLAGCVRFPEQLAVIADDACVTAQERARVRSFGIEVFAARSRREYVRGILERPGHAGIPPTVGARHRAGLTCSE